jgi:hypothetical protein
MVTRGGIVKDGAFGLRHETAERHHRHQFEGADELRFVFQTDGKKEIILASRKGMSVRFNEFPKQNERERRLASEGDRAQHEWRVWNALQERG